MAVKKGRKKAPANGRKQQPAQEGADAEPQPQLEAEQEPKGAKGTKKAPAGRGRKKAAAKPKPGAAKKAAGAGGGGKAKKGEEGAPPAAAAVAIPAIIPVGVPSSAPQASQAPGAAAAAAARGSWGVASLPLGPVPVGPLTGLTMQPPLTFPLDPTLGALPVSLAPQAAALAEALAAPATGPLSDEEEARQLYQGAVDGMTQEEVEAERAEAAAKGAAAARGQEPLARRASGRKTRRPAALGDDFAWGDAAELDLSVRRGSAGGEGLDASWLETGVDPAAIVAGKRQRRAKAVLDV